MRSPTNCVVAFAGLLFVSLTMCSRPPDKVAKPPELAAPATRIIVYQAELPPGPPYNGACFSRSLTIIRPDAYRCSTEENVASAGSANLFDPCFVVRGEEDKLACEPDPVTGSPGILVVLTEPLPAEPLEEAEENSAWLVQLDDGTACQLSAEATFLVDDQEASYSCSDGSWLFGDLQPGRVWTALRATVMGEPPDVQFDRKTTAIIRTVWR